MKSALQASTSFKRLLSSLMALGTAFLLAPHPVRAQYGSPGAPYTQTSGVDACTSSSVSLNTMAINQFYLYSASGVSVLYAAGVNTPGTGNIILQTTPPVGASIVQAYLEVVEQSPSWTLAPVSFGTGLTAAGIETGQATFENDWTDPRYGANLIAGNENLFYGNIRYDVTSLVSSGTSSYTTNAPGLLDALVIVYTVPASVICGAVAIGEGLFAWDSGPLGLDWGVTPWASTLDWSCQHPQACAANQFSRWGGVGSPDRPVSFTDEFFGTDSPSPPQPPVTILGEGAIFQDTSTLNDTFLDTYNNVPLSNSAGKITWGLGNLLNGEKEFYWVNLLAASCNSICSSPTVTPTFTRSNTPTVTSTPTITLSPTASFTPTATSTPTDSMTPTASLTATPSPTLTNTPTITFTPTDSPTLTYSWTPTATPTFTVTFTPTNSFSFTPTSTATYSPTITATMTATNSFTSTPTLTDTNTPTFSYTATATPSATPTSTPTWTFTKSFTPTVTWTFTSSFTPTETATSTFTFTATSSPTPTFSFTATFSPTWTSTATPTYSPTRTFTPTQTSSPTPTLTFTLTPTITLSPTPTATFPPGCDDFFISKNAFSPNQGPVSIHVDYCTVPGPYYCKIYNSAGEYIRTLDEQTLTVPLSKSYFWDGKNAYGQDCASGLYLFYVLEPFNYKIRRVLLIR